MTPHDVRVPGARRITARRFALLASVAAIGAGVLLAGPGGFDRMSFAATSQPVQASATAHPAGFADLVAKVKPAVISVRVKIDQASAETTGSGGGNVPFGNGAPLDKFFQQFGFSDAPKGMRQPRQVITGEGSGFFISADGYAVTNNHVVDHAEPVQVTDRRRHDLHRQGDRHRSEDRPRADQGRRRRRVPVRHVRRQGAAHRRLGGGGRQSVRPRRHRDGRHRVGARPRHRRRSLRRLHPDRRADQQGQLGRPGVRRRRQRDRRQHGDLLAVRRLGRHRLRRSGRHRQDGRGAAQGQRPGHPRLDGRAGAAGHPGHRRQPGPEAGAGRARRRAASRAARPPRPASRRATSSRR